METFAAIFLAATLCSGVSVQGPDPAKSRIRELVPSAQASVEVRLGPVDWRGLTIHVQTRRAPATGRVGPPWAAAWAIPARGRIVIRTDRIGPYPYSSERQVLTHELVHIAVHRLRRDGAVPRWFDEGLSMSIARELGPRDALQLAIALLTDPDVTLDSLDGRFLGDQREVQTAYALSFSFLRWLERSHDVDVGRRILMAVARGHAFPDAVHRVTGQRLLMLAADWQRHVILRWRWIPLATSATTLWLGISLLAVAAWARIRRRNRRRLEQMELDEMSVDRTLH